ncbi:hypothetical protein MHLP_00825 [Candidatus Mycoplasma haematolamae str. Purdue]|uniref:Uncharacterized protein n=1 Tax=Mycoplasma haematolamae (strain Purdue) TaxID=1212765 RepID=I7B912_MYCHA|nr:hypothetical protein [Candidatus Mycoplasma haematolamae]AFO51745.1 hypothetical protein MHLP_00825 [Candidatus Mycoplasma haematolamae str. Purdue]
MITKVLALKVGLPALLVGGGTYGAVELMSQEYETSGVAFYVSNQDKEWSRLICPAEGLSESQYSNLQLLKVSSDRAEILCVAGSEDQKEKLLQMKVKSQGDDELKNVVASESGEINKLRCESKDISELRVFECLLEGKKLKIKEESYRDQDKESRKLVIQIKKD